MPDFDISDEVISFFEDLDKTAEEAPSTEAPAETGAEATPEASAEAATPVEGDEAPVTLETAENAPETPEETTEQPTEEEPDTWEDRYKNLQSQKDKEIAAVNQRLAEMQNWAQQQYAWQQQQVAEQHQRAQAEQQQQNVQVSRDQLDQAIETDLRGTFQWVAYNRPDLVGHTIAMVRGKEQYGHEVADLMQVEFNQFLAQQTQQQNMQLRQEMQAPQQVAEAMGAVETALLERHGESFSALQPEVAAKAQELAPAFKQYMDAHGEEITPKAVFDFMTNVYHDVREAKLTEAAAQPRTAVPLTPQQHVESSNAAPRNEVSAEEDAINEIVRGAQNMGIEVTPASA